VTVRGRLERRAVSGGTWVLVTREGTWTLYGTVDPKLSGQDVEVEGDEGGFGIGMAGPSLSVRQIKGC
jgi:hypothetical protein